MCKSLRGGYELFYHSISSSVQGLYAQPEGFQGPVFSVTLKAAGDALDVASPQEVIRAMAVRLPHPGGDYHTFGVSNDAARFLVMQRVLTQDASITNVLPELPAQGLTVAMNWIQALRKK